jgi:hypothetical protein
MFAMNCEGNFNDAASGSHPVLLPALLGLLLLFLLTTSASALIRVGKGNDPVPDDNWPAGSLEVANLKTRVGLPSRPIILPSLAACVRSVKSRKLRVMSASHGEEQRTPIGSAMVTG